MRISIRGSWFVAALLLLAGCGGNGDEARIEDQVESLVDALNGHDLAAAGKLYTDGTLAPVTVGGDSSAIYRMIAIPSGSDFEATNVQSIIAGDQARTSFDLTGKVRHGDSLAGTMTLRLKMELQKMGEEWKFVAGTEGQETM
jgi:ketosteroid isomerase-like protein